MQAVLGPTSLDSSPSSPVCVCVNLCRVSRDYLKNSTPISFCRLCRNPIRGVISNGLKRRQVSGSLTNPKP